MGRGRAANLQKAGYELVANDLSMVAAQPFIDKVCDGGLRHGVLTSLARKD